MSIGQGQVSVTPVSMAVDMATLANGGTRVTPHLLKAVDDGSGWKPVPPPPPQSQVDAQARRRCRRFATGCGWSSTAPAPAAGARIAGPRRVGQDRHGAGHLASRAAGGAGKTDKDLRDNGWFVFFAPRDNPQIAGVVFAEHGEHGAERRADRAARARDVLREEGRAAAAARRTEPDSCRDRRTRRRRRRVGRRRRSPEPAAVAVTAARTEALMFERRLYYHIDWALLGRDPRAVRASASR